MNINATRSRVSSRRGGTRRADEYVEAFARGLAVIRAFSAGHETLSISTVAARSGLTRAGARRLLLTLTELGYAAARDGLFSLTPKVLELGFSYLSSLTLYGLARPLVERLARETNELCTMSVRDGDSAIYVVRAEIRTPLSRSFGLGSRLPLFATSMGRVLLADLDDSGLDRFLRSTDLEPFTRYTKVDADRVREEVARARRQGWCLVKQELELGVCGLSVPVLDADGRVAAAVSISMNMARFDEAQTLKEFLPRLRAVAGEIGVALHSSRPAGKLVS